MKNESKLYRVFDTVVASELELPEAVPAAGEEPQASIEIGQLPAYVHQAIEDDPKGFWFGIVSERDMWLKTRPAFFHITGGKQVTIQPRPEVSDDIELLRIYLLGTTFAILQIQNGRLPVHGGTLIKNGKAMIVAGESGAGKSTVTTALVQKGLPFLADDVSVLDVGPKAIEVLPAYPQRKLCRDAALTLGYDPDNMVKLLEERDKFAVRGAELWCPHRVPLGTMVEITLKESGPVELIPVPGHQRLQLLHRNIYRWYIHIYQGVNPEYMKKCLRVASATPMYQLARPKSEDTLAEVVDVLMKLPING